MTYANASSRNEYSLREWNRESLAPDPYFVGGIDIKILR